MDVACAFGCDGDERTAAAFDFTRVGVAGFRGCSTAAFPGGGKAVADAGAIAAGGEVVMVALLGEGGDAAAAAVCRCWYCCARPFINPR